MYLEPTVVIVVAVVAVVAVAVAVAVPEGTDLPVRRSAEQGKAQDPFDRGKESGKVRIRGDEVVRLDVDPIAGE